MVVSRDELAVHCHLDEGALLDHAMKLAEIKEQDLICKGCVDTPSNHGKFCLAVMNLTLWELDNPGQEIPRGIQVQINELKFVKPAKKEE